MDGTYTVVFEKLAEALAEEIESEAVAVELTNLQTEAEEIATLRRIVSEITTPEVIFFSGT